MAEVEKEYKDLSDYASYNEKTRVIEINWEKINKLDNSTNEKLTSRIEEYISKLEQAQSNIDE
jgi:DNA-binding transcriptional regulator GbsR (MarR family)